MNEDVEVMREYMEALGLDQRPATIEDIRELETLLNEGNESGLADYVGKLKTPEELQDLMDSIFT